MHCKLRLSIKICKTSSVFFFLTIFSDFFHIHLNQIEQEKKVSKLNTQVVFKWCTLVTAVLRNYAEPSEI